MNAMCLLQSHGTWSLNVDGGFLQSSTVGRRVVEV